METTYIVTAEMDEESFAWLNGLRREHFPAERNFLPAHLTLFHRLSSAQVAILHSIEVPPGPVDIRFDRIVFLGFCVAIHASSPDLERLRDKARAQIRDELSRQDIQPWKPHVTVQNKVSAETARQLQQKLSDSFTARGGAVMGLLIWQYLGGPWKLADRIAFGKM